MGNWDGIDAKAKKSIGQLIYCEGWFFSTLSVRLALALKSQLF